ncbi:acyl-protein thioesterase 2-like, partial [Trifolium medium]|nr:acyl-protein thioesterase 2-like [Trifolium medium]
SGNASRTFEFGRTHVVRPKGKHQATIVWLHGIGDNGSRCVANLNVLCS